MLPFHSTTTVAAAAVSVDGDERLGGFVGGRWFGAFVNHTSFGPFDHLLCSEGLFLSYCTPASRQTTLLNGDRWVGGRALTYFESAPYGNNSIDISIIVIAPTAAAINSWKMTKNIELLQMLVGTMQFDEVISR